MEMNGDQPPLIWPQFESTGYTRRRSQIPTIIVPAMIGVISAAMFLLFTTFVVPPFLSVTTQILQPATVKRGWDSINVVLVVFAILCGVLARRNDDGSSPSSHGQEEEVAAVASGEVIAGEETTISSSPAVSHEWFDDVYDADRLKIYESFSSRSFSHSLPVTGTVPLRRSSTSYPDLRNGVLRRSDDRPFRFYDDFEIDKYRSHSTVVIDEQPQSRFKTEIQESEPKEIHVDKFVVRPSSPPQQPPEPPPNPPPPAEVVQKPRRTHRSVRNRDTHEKPRRSDTTSDSRFKRTLRPPPSPPPPPPPPPPPLVTATPPRTLQRRKSNAAKEIKMVFASLYNQGKRKKKLQKHKRKEGTESPVVVEAEPPQYRSSIPPPSPPPPPPPPPPRSSQSVFYGLFKKGVKSKKIHSIPAPPPPPPPRMTKLAPQTPPRRVKSGRPPRPTKPTSFNEESYQGSPLIQTTPPPPPPPPFRVPPLKFVVSGDFAKIRSNQSSRCSSPEREVIDVGWGLELTQSEGGEENNAAVNSGGAAGTGFCPSPDVNTKADNFIARLRDEWRLDKMNSVSVKGKRNMSSV
ncbi:hypothetical protein Bca4012_045057 [Brassica carinata]|uniref:Uncharacterized protein n=3 Tax=Brassica TaxID=3705 RepID=A0A0D3EBZ6_BRAOL|nr:PREDICTED: formin-like protein 13 [Brassica oleracea var. oleracea]XP_022565881.2 formin-like protein 13 [Brassica napus]CAF1765697.1 unnamed protein product [Brassica napus]CDY53977.1 BnaC09g53440D [Brassica napus]VDD32400.1 unnamed protein product [Brassica oleracea]